MPASDNITPINFDLTNIDSVKLLINHCKEILNTRKPNAQECSALQSTIAKTKILSTSCSEQMKNLYHRLEELHRHFLDVYLFSKTYIDLTDDLTLRLIIAYYRDIINKCRKQDLYPSAFDLRLFENIFKLALFKKLACVSVFKIIHFDLLTVIKEKKAKESMPVTDIKAVAVLRVVDQSCKQGPAEDKPPMVDKISFLMMSLT